MRQLKLASLSALAAIAFAVGSMAACNSESTDDPEGDYYEGVGEDEWDPTAPMDDGKSDIPAYAIPTNLPALKSPEIIVSLKGLTVHLFDRETGFSAVYPAGPGVLGRNGRSITPIGHFKTGGNVADSWWYAPRRTSPEYFAGLPFLRLTARNTEGANTYALHGPITRTLTRGYVSHGCIRMAAQDVINLFWMVKKSAAAGNTPVTIQQEVEIDAAGKAVDVGKTATLFAKGATIPYGASVGARPL
jgi:hypothetical protein